MIRKNKNNKIKLMSFGPLFMSVFYTLETVNWGEFMKMLFQAIIKTIPIIGTIVLWFMSSLTGTSTVSFTYDDNLINCDTENESSICKKNVIGYKTYYYTDAVNTVKPKIKITDSNNEFTTKKAYLIKRVCDNGVTCTETTIETRDINSNNYEFSIDVSNYKDSKVMFYIKVDLCKDNQEQCSSYESRYIRYASADDIIDDNPYNANNYSEFNTNVEYNLSNYKFSGTYNDLFSNYYVVGNNATFVNSVQTIIDRNLTNDVSNVARCVLISGIHAQLFSGDGKTFTQTYTVDGKTYQYDSGELTTRVLNGNSFSKNQPWFRKYAVSGTNSAGTGVEFVKEMAMTKAKFLGTIRDQIKKGEASNIPLYIESDNQNQLHVVTAIGVSKTGMNKKDTDLDFNDILIMDNTLPDSCDLACLGVANAFFYLTTLGGNLETTFTAKIISCPTDTARCNTNSNSKTLKYPYKMNDFANDYGGFYLSYDLK